MQRSSSSKILAVALDVDVGASLAALGSKLLDSMKSAVECSTIESNALLEHAMTQIVDAYAYEVADTVVDAFEDKAADLLEACAYEVADIVIPAVALDVGVGVSLAALGSKLLDSMKSAVECSTIESNALLEHAMTQIVDDLSIIQLVVLPWQAPDLFEAYAYEVADTVDAFEDKAADLLEACAFEGVDIVVGA
ncbi:hypothetical protein EZV62_017909 [Acer yangbiense]|uniref:Uncharacterized protein n=1 Tax=Acer yangbiense TaxID=1000413 RepID=A0A5C7HK45_9ROSI|nr:hypothetical protein EZV62_017909 [Acer yangbiense]